MGDGSWSMSKLEQQAMVMTMAQEHSKFLQFLMRRAVDWTDDEDPWTERLPRVEGAASPGESAADAPPVDPRRASPRASPRAPPPRRRTYAPRDGDDFDFDGASPSPRPQSGGGRARPRAASDVAPSRGAPGRAPAPRRHRSWSLGQAPDDAAPRGGGGGDDDARADAAASLAPSPPARPRVAARIASALRRPRASLSGRLRSAGSATFWPPRRPASASATSRRQPRRSFDASTAASPRAAPPARPAPAPRVVGADARSPAPPSAAAPVELPVELSVEAVSRAASPRAASPPPIELPALQDARSEPRADPATPRALAAAAASPRAIATPRRVVALLAASRLASPSTPSRAPPCGGDGPALPQSPADLTLARADDPEGRLSPPPIPVM